MHTNSDPGSVDVSSVKLAAGSHGSPGLGICAVELASMLAGEDFSDRPRCVCPVIGAMVRAWNDRVRHHDRQRLRPYCELMIGTRGEEATERRREIVLRWIEAQGAGGPPDGSAQRHRTWGRIAVHCGFTALVKRNEGVGEYAARVAFGRRDHDGFFSLLDEMLGLRASSLESPVDVPEIGSLFQRSLSPTERRDPHRDPLDREIVRRPVNGPECSDAPPGSPCGDEESLSRI